MWRHLNIEEAETRRSLVLAGQWVMTNKGAPCSGRNYLKDKEKHEKEIYSAPTSEFCLHMYVCTYVYISIYHMQEKSLWILKHCHVLLCVLVGLCFHCYLFMHFFPYTLQREKKSQKNSSKDLFRKSSVKLILFIPIINIIVWYMVYWGSYSI